MEESNQACAGGANVTLYASPRVRVCFCCGRFGVSVPVLDSTCMAWMSIVLVGRMYNNDHVGSLFLLCFGFVLVKKHAP